MISAWRWDKIIILYENHNSLERLEGILQLTGKGYMANNIVIQQLPNRPPITQDENIFWPLMKRLKDTYPDYTNIIVDCDSADKIPEILKAANQSSMTKDPYKYFLTMLVSSYCLVSCKQEVPLCM